jgi:hypothetical protein
VLLNKLVRFVFFGIIVVIELLVKDGSWSLIDKDYPSLN